MKITVTNERALAMCAACDKHVDDRGMLGYACARNARKLTEASLEYERIRNDAIRELGEAVTDASGAETYGINPSSPNWGEFLERIGKIADVEHEVEIMQIEPSEVIGKMTGREALDLDWMIREVGE